MINLFNGERQLSAKLVKGYDGPVWLLFNADRVRLNRKYVPFDHSHRADAIRSRSKVQVSLGLHQERT